MAHCERDTLASLGLTLGTQAVQRAGRFDIHLAIVLAVDLIQGFAMGNDIVTGSRGRGFRFPNFRDFCRLGLRTHGCLYRVVVDTICGVLSDVDTDADRLVSVLDEHECERDSDETINKLLLLAHLKLHSVAPFVG